jgi:two-component system, NtrC family, response regulator
MNMHTRARILIIDDRDDLLRFCERVLGGEFQFLHVSSAGDARTVLTDPTRPVDAILLDRDFSRSDPTALIGPRGDARNEGIHILRWLKGEYAAVPVLMVTGFREQAPAIEAADLGTDFLGWQDVIADPHILKSRLVRMLETSRGPGDAILSRYREMGIVVDSPRFAQTLLALTRAVPGTGPILLLGETGTGKDTLAYAHHMLAGNLSRPYVAVNVAGLNPGLIESELFGHARGAFTGAERATIGKLRAADDGTLLLNEIGDLSLEVQAKLLSALERDEVVPVGAVQAFPARFRLISATSQDLPDLVDRGQFRRDLYHRIAWHTIEVPPLRERREEIPHLIAAFLRSGGRVPEDVKGITQEAIEYLCGQPWPGNIRELKAVVEAAGAIATYIITLKDVREISNRRGAAASPRSATGTGVAEVHHCEDVVFGTLRYREVTARYFDYLYRKTGGRLPEIARLARISKTTAYEWRDRFAGGEDPPGKAPTEPSNGG